MLDVLTDRPLGLVEQLGQLLLVQPKRFRLQHHVDAGGAVFALVDQELLGIGHGAVVGEGVGAAEIHWLYCPLSLTRWRTLLRNKA